MRAGRRAPDGEELPVVLLDDDGARGVTTTASVELGGAPPPRRRRKQAAGVAAAALVVVTLAFLGGGDDAGTDEADTTTETTPRSSRRETGEELRRTSTTGRPPRFTTTTVSPVLLSGTGPLLPGLPSGTTIGIVDSAGVATIIDLDTGSGCSVKVTSADAWGPWGSRALPTLWVQGPSGVSEVDPTCEVSRQSGLGRGWPAAVAGASMWVGEGDGGRLREVSLETHEPTGRAVDVPRFAQMTLAAVDGGLVVGANGDMTFVDLGTGERTPLGAGMVLAGHRRSVIYTSCPALRCNVSVREVDGGEPRVLAEMEIMPWEPAAVSPDGRFVALPSYDGTGRPSAVVLDVRRGGVVLESSLEQVVFTDDSRWLLGVEIDDLVAVPLDRSGERVPIELSGHVVRLLAVLRAPSG